MFLTMVYGWMINTLISIPAQRQTEFCLGWAQSYTLEVNKKKRRKNIHDCIYTWLSRDHDSVIVPSIYICFFFIYIMLNTGMMHLIFLSIIFTYQYLIGIICPQLFYAAEPSLASKLRLVLSMRHSLLVWRGFFYRFLLGGLRPSGLCW